MFNKILIPQIKFSIIPSAGHKYLTQVNASKLHQESVKIHIPEICLQVSKFHLASLSLLGGFIIIQIVAAVFLSKKK